jgi:hypothetical protein
MTVGSPGVFAIESRITQAYDVLSLRALGCFLIYVSGYRYGVDADDASMLANSYDAVVRRLQQRGAHQAPFAFAEGIDIAHAVDAALYTECGHQTFFGLSQSEFGAFVSTACVLWAPDGDEAFDDGSHVLHFDVGDRVRLLAFKRDAGRVSTASLSDVWLPQQEFYTILQIWRNEFDKEWAARPKLAPGN